MVKEERKYPSWADWDFPDRPYINQTFGISRAKTLLNNLHFMLGNGGVTTDEKRERHNFSQVCNQSMCLQFTCPELNIKIIEGINLKLKILNRWLHVEAEVQCAK